jgi:hypothetical protein
MSSVTMLTCATCGNEEPEGSRFCGNCGSPFAPEEPQPASAVGSNEATLTCATCGNAEPWGSRFCGNCGSAFAPAGLADAAAPETPARRAALEEPARAAPPLAPSPGRKRRLRWVAAGAAVVLLLAGGTVAATLMLADGDDATGAVPTEQQSLPSATSESPPSSTGTLVDGFHPYLVELVGYQGALSARVRSLEAGARSFVALRQAADALGVRFVGAQAFLGDFAPADREEANTLSLLNRALAAHLAYAVAISNLPPRPRSFTSAEAREALARAEQAEIAYAALAAAEPAISGISPSRSDHVRLLELVPSAKPPRPTAVRRVTDLVPALVGIRPDDPLGEGRCFGPYPGASLRVAGVVYRSGFIQCGDDSDGDPSRASAVYRFSGRTFPAGSRLVRLTAQAVIDEFSSLSQRGSSVTWTVLYGGAPICSETVVWNTSRPSPRRLDCRVPLAVASGGFDLGRLRIQQVASLASSETFWAGLFHPTAVVEVTR